MRSLKQLLTTAQTAQALRWSQCACALPAHSRQLASDSSSASEIDSPANGSNEPEFFDAAVQSAPVAVHELIGDPRTGIADDTTTTPWGEDLNVEWVWTSNTEHNVTEWYRYSLAGPDQLPYMYMDSRLSDHSKNLMYMLRCKDPQRWTIPALAEKFRIRRQRVMAILTLKEMQAHRIEQAQDMQGPLQPYAFRIPLQDFHIQPDGQPVDLAQLVANQQDLQQKAAAAAASSSSSGTAAVTDGLGSLEEFIAPTETTQQQQQQPDALSSLAAAAGGQAADLAALMPRVALSTQELELQLLQLLQQHHYSIEELQRRLLHQVDVAEGYYNAHIAGTELETLLLQSAGAGKQETAVAEASSEAGGGDAAAGATKPDWLNFDKQRQEIQQLLTVLEPLLQFAGPEHDREAGRLLAALQHILQQAAAEGGSEQQLDTAAALSKVIGSADPAVFAAAFNQLEHAKRQQLLDFVPEARITLNVQGTDLKAALSHNSSSSSGDQKQDEATSSRFAASLPGVWPGQVPTVVDVWNYEEVPRKQLAALQTQLPVMQQLLAQVEVADAGIGSHNNSSSSSSSSSSSVECDDVAAVQNAVQVYSGLLWQYDKVLAEQAAAAVGAAGKVPLHASAQRRLMRILREIDMMAIQKLLLWESFYKEEATDASSDRRASRKAEELDLKQRRINRLRKHIHALLKQLDADTAAQGQPGPYDDYPDLPADTPDGLRVDKELASAHLDAVVVGRQFHRGSGDRHFKRIQSYPKFEGYSLEEFDSIQEGELSIISRLAAEREDNMMWKEFRERLLKNIGLTAPDLYQHISKARPPKPIGGWSYVVHPMGGAAHALNRQQMRWDAEAQWLDDDAVGAMGSMRPGDVGAAYQGFDPSRDAAPSQPYVAEPGQKIRDLTEEEKVVIGASRPRPRRRWYASTRSRVL